jgi:hypothetical protein
MIDLNGVVSLIGIFAIVLMVLIRIKIVNVERRKYRQAIDRLNDILDDVGKEIRLHNNWSHGGGFSDWLRDKWR